MDVDELRFGGRAYGIAEDELSASFGEDSDNMLIKELYAEYVTINDRDRDGWLRERLASLFPCVGERPRWIQQLPAWAFLDGRPMTFVGQMSVPDTANSRVRASPGCTLYIFGSRVSCGPGWAMTYRVIEQNPGL
jgi:hypothetical protein